VYPFLQLLLLLLVLLLLHRLTDLQPFNGLLALPHHQLHVLLRHLRLRLLLVSIREFFANFRAIFHETGDTESFANFCTIHSIKGFCLFIMTISQEVTTTKQFDF
jgi:hypothetical protein